MFRIADCSNSMKGNLVRELKGYVAATSVTATRAREVRGGRDTEELFKTKSSEPRTRGSRGRWSKSGIVSLLRPSPNPRSQPASDVPPGKEGKSQSRLRRRKERVRPPFSDEL